MNNSKEQTVKQEKSAEEILKARWDESSFKSLYHVTNTVALQAMNDYGLQFKQHIAELESQVEYVSNNLTKMCISCTNLQAELDRKDKALIKITKIPLYDWSNDKGISNYREGYNSATVECQDIAEQALKPKD